MANLVLVRHGATEWSKAGKHTGLSDIPLSSEGEAQARRVGSALRDETFDLVLVSPLRRARRTAELAGLSAPEVEPNLAEWDYGGYEGLTTAEISSLLGRSWTVVHDGVVPGDTPGETIEQVAARADAVVARVRPVVDGGGDAIVVAHGHYLRILACRWLGFEPLCSGQFVLGPGTVSRLGYEHGVSAVTLWNWRPA